MKQGEKMLPHPDILNEAEYGRFVLANLAAKRARQIKDGAPPLVRIDSNHPVSVALAEIAANKLKPLFASDAEDAQAVAEHLASLEGLEIGDMGLLLPSLEGEIDLITEEFADEEEDEEPVVEPIDLLGVGEDDEVATPEDASPEISLHELAGEEEAAEEDESEQI
jgi:DNA-directed RNA polymerase subunit omega